MFRQVSVLHLAENMKPRKIAEFCVIAEGSFASEHEAEHAVRDPFIEDWVEAKGKFRIHNLTEIMVAPNVALGSLKIAMVDEGVFEIAGKDPDKPLSERQAQAVAQRLKHHDMFDTVTVEARETPGGSES